MKHRPLPAWVLPLVFLLGGLAPCGGDSFASSGLYPLLHFGRVLLADASRLELRRVGTFSPAGPAIAEYSHGRIWGRLEPRHLAALDPAREQIVYRVKLSRKPDALLVVSDGEAYVTHRSPEKESFVLSVVDTGRGVLLRELKGLAALPVRLVEAGGFVYAAAAGVLRKDPMEWHLYQIEKGTDRLREVLGSAETGWSWALAASGSVLYLGYLPAADNPQGGRVEVREARSFHLLGSWDNPRGPLRGLHAREAEVLLFREAAVGNTELLILDPLLRDARRTFLLQGPVARVLGVHGATMVYLDRAFETGQTDVSVCFYDLQAGAERKRINIRQFLIAESGE